MRSTRRANASLTMTGLAVILACVCAILFLAEAFLTQTRHGHPVKAICKSNLKQIGTAMNIYLTKYGGDSSFAEPAAAFRGDEFIAMTFWVDIIQVPRLFTCPATSDTGPVDEAGDAVPIPTVWGQAGNLADEQCSYAGRCKGLTGQYAYRNTTPAFTKALRDSASPMACDKAGNHSDGVSVVYFDSHVTFIPEAGDKVGADNSGLNASDPTNELQHMDGGEK